MRSGLFTFILIAGLISVVQAENLPVVTGFEAPTFTAGPLPQQGWNVDNGSASIQTSVKRTGAQALRIDTDSQIDKALTSGSNVVYIDAWYRADNLDGDRPDIASLQPGSSILVFEAGAGIVALNGNGTGGGTWQTLGVPLVTGQFYRITIAQDYSSKTWAVFVNGSPVPAAAGLGFKDNSVTTLSGLKVKAAPSGNSYLDDFAAQTSLPDFLIPTATPTLAPTATPTPIGPDFDGDGIADSLEGGKNAGLLGKSSMYLFDSDGDGLHDGIEDINRNGVKDANETSAIIEDTDDDGYEDGIEVLLLSSNPLDPNSPAEAFADADGDGLPDSIDPNPAEADTDNDRFLDGYEAVMLGMAAVTNAAQKPMLGDVDHNGFRDNADAQKTLNFFANVAQVAFDPNQCDVNRDAVIDNADAQRMLMFFAQILPHYPIK